jgi:LPS O-antigen subunit length determinant protein (WzzB/FepE family)
MSSCYVIGHSGVYAIDFICLHKYNIEFICLVILVVMVMVIQYVAYSYVAAQQYEHKAIEFLEIVYRNVNCL